MPGQCGQASGIDRGRVRALSYYLSAEHCSFDSALHPAECSTNLVLQLGMWQINSQDEIYIPMYGLRYIYIVLDNIGQDIT
jgi:hypothetical protein